MKRFLILMTALLLSNFLKADVSCWYYPTYNYYLFKILEPGKEDEDFLKFWNDYAGGKTPVYSYDFSSRIDEILSDIENGKSDKAALNAAIQKKDAEMLDYLKDLSTYLNVNQDFYNQWEYPDENQIKEYKEVYEKLLEKATKYSGQRLKDRYNLMAMRCMFQLEKYPEVEKFWLNDGIKTQDEKRKKHSDESYVSVSSFAFSISASSFSSLSSISNASLEAFSRCFFSTVESTESPVAALALSVSASVN